MKKELLHLAGTLCTAFALATPAFAGMLPPLPDDHQADQPASPTATAVAAEAAYTPEQQKILSCVQEAMQSDGVLKVTKLLDPPGALPARTPFGSAFVAKADGDGLSESVNLSIFRRNDKPKSLSFFVAVEDAGQKGFAQGFVSYQDLTGQDPAKVTFRDDKTDPDRPQLRTDLDTEKYSDQDRKAAAQATKVAQKIQGCLKK